MIFNVSDFLTGSFDENVDDSQGLDDAIDAVSQAGGGELRIDRPIMLKAGIKNAISCENISISSVGSGVIHFVGGINPAIFAHRAHGLSIRNLRIVGKEGLHRSSDNFCIFVSETEDIEIVGCKTRYGLSGIWLNKCSRIDVSRNFVHDTSADGIHLAVGCQDGDVSHNLVVNPKDDHFACTSDKIGMNNPIRTSNINFSHNRARGGAWGSAFAVYDCDRIQIEHNRGYDIPGSGVSLTVDQDPSVFNQDIDVLDNTFVNVGLAEYVHGEQGGHLSGFQSGCGIFIGNTKNSRAKGNKIRAAIGANRDGGVGIGVRNVDTINLSNNDIDTAKFGIVGSGSCISMSVSDNDFNMIHFGCADFYKNNAYMSGRFVFDNNKGRGVGYVNGSPFITTSESWGPNSKCYVTKNTNTDGRLLALMGNAEYVKQYNTPAS